MKTINEYGILYKRFTRNTGEETRTNKFSFLLLKDSAFRSTIRNNKDLYNLFQQLCWTDENILSNIDRLCVMTGNVTYSRFGNGEFMLDIPEFWDFRVSQKPEWIAYSREGHPNVRERATVLYKKSLANFGIKIANEKVLLNRIAELFSIKWKSYAKGNDYSLHIDKNFEDIYNTTADMCSCMQHKGFQIMYAESVAGANACYITDKDGDIVARAILWDSVQGSDGKTYRYLDRIYSMDGKADLQKILLDKVIEAGAVDLYKPVGTSCSDADNIVDLHGKRVGLVLSITMWAGIGDTVAYLDTFKYYNQHRERAFNSDSEDYDFELTRTDGLMAEMTYSDYYEDYIEEDDAVWSEDVCSYIREDDDNFVRIDDDNREDYVQISNVVYCDDDGEYHHVDDSTRAEDTGNYFYDTDDLYFTIDTESYYEYDDKLFYVEYYGYYECSDGLVWSDMNNTYIWEDESIYVEDLEDYDYVGNKTDYHNIDGKLYAKDESIKELV